MDLGLPHPFYIAYTIRDLHVQRQFKEKHFHYPYQVEMSLGSHRQAQAKRWHLLFLSFITYSRSLFASPVKVTEENLKR